MLEFHPKRELFAVRQDTPHRRPQNRFLCKGVGEDQAIDFEEGRLLLAHITLPKPVQQLIQSDVVPFLAAEDAPAPAQFGDALLRD
jgi:hypothetical protein